MTASIQYSKTIPIREDVDVFVAGGGPAGVAAALVAARQGKKVFLAEGQACLGGMGTSGEVPAFMMFGDGINFLAGGIGQEVYDRLNETREGVMKEFKMSIAMEDLKRLYDQMLIEAGVEFSFHTTLVDVVTKGGKVEAAICNAKSGFFAVKAKMFIDGTGDGDLAVFAGASFEKGDENGEMMPGTLCSIWADIDFDRYYEFRRSAPDAFTKALHKAFDDGVFTVNDPHHPGVWRVGTHIGGGNFGHAFGVDPDDERSLTKHLVAGRKGLMEFRRFYREYVPGFEHADLVSSGALLGIREGRRITGDYQLTADDFLERSVFDDEIGRYCYPIDMHPRRPSAETYAKFLDEFRKKFRYGKGESYGIPYRILLPKGLDNVLVTGRCVSTDYKMEGSLRVMPGCYITGQAAGMAAAIAATLGTDTRGVPVSTLLEKLQAIGAFLPNFTPTR